MQRLFSAALLLGVMASPAWAQDVRIYVTTATNPGGFVDADSKTRQDTVADLKKRLQKKKRLVVVEDASGAHLQIEILGRGLEETGGVNVRSRYQIGGSDLTPNKEMTIRSRLRVGEYETELVAQNQPGALFESARWQDLAGKLANQIEKWVKDNRARLLQQQK